MTREERRQYYRNLEQTMTQQERADLQREREDRRRKYLEQWNHMHYRTVSCRVPRATAERFAALCHRHGKTPYRALKDAIEDALRRDIDAQGTPPPQLGGLDGRQFS